MYKYIVYRYIYIYIYIYYIYNLLTLDKTLIKNQNKMLEVKSAILKMKNTFNEFTIKLDMPRERICELEDALIKT